MEAQTATTPSEAATGSRTLADLLPLAVEKHADLPAQRYKDQDKGEWVDVSYPELGAIAKEVSLGLQELGIERGDKVGILVEHPARVDLLRLRDPGRRRHRGADLPDELARGVPLRARPLRVDAR